ncbi:MAG: efflux RND transporter periplasmic adaptor subunit [Gallionella sp.]|nr:efflux RND transporter periplasmic adaptor subunit [Gallionella sp.]
MNKKILLGVVVVAVVAGAILVTKGKKPEVPATVTAQKPALTVMIALPETQVWQVRVSASGGVLPWQEAIIGAEIGGLRLAEVLVNVGDSVKKGQVLARFADELSQATLNQQQAAADEAKARFAEATVHLQRAQSIKDSGAMSAQELLQLSTAADTARAQVQSAEARLAAEKLRLNYTRVVASDDGLISARTATVGAVMQAGAEMFRLIRQGKLEWRAELSDAALQQVRLGQKVKVLLAQGDALVASVVRISPVIDPQTRNGTVYVALPSSPALRAGTFLQGEFELGTSNALTLPQSAVVMRDGFAYVYRAGKDNRVMQLKVTTGRHQQDRVEILSGVMADMSVVTSGAGFLNDGDVVRLADRHAAVQPELHMAVRPELVEGCFDKLSTNGCLLPRSI